MSHPDRRREHLCEECPQAVLVFLSRHRIVGTTCVVVVAITLVFCSWRIYVTSKWLQALRDYTVARDAEWGPFLHAIEDHLTRQDADNRAIRENQARIMEAIARPRP